MRLHVAEAGMFRKSVLGQDQAPSVSYHSAAFVAEYSIIWLAFVPLEIKVKSEA